MKIKIEKSRPSEDMKFPRLMQSVVHDTVVLFTSRAVGVTLKSSNISTIGKECKHFTPADDPHWKPFDGKITLEND